MCLEFILDLYRDSPNNITKVIHGPSLTKIWSQYFFVQQNSSPKKCYEDFTENIFLFYLQVRNKNDICFSYLTNEKPVLVFLIRQRRNCMFLSCESTLYSCLNVKGLVA